MTTEIADHARDALVPTCGSCHRSDLPTAKAGALAVFDLTKDPWWATIKDDQYDALLRRVRGTSGIADEDRAAIETFVAAIRPSSPPTPAP
jgi:mono/diheme cytochrome c family protein